MGDGKRCPACGQNIGVWPVFSAGLPNRIRCPHCSTRLRYHDAGWVVIVLLFVLAGVIAAGYYAAELIPGLDPRFRPAAAVGIMLGAWVVVELVAARYLRGNRRLVRRDRPGGAEHADRDS
jgi:uncharacterized protein (DUF983 family)